jgi:hypothetical protein
MPPEEFGNSMVGVLDLAILPTPSDETIQAFEKVRDARTFVELQMQTPWKSLPSRVSHGALNGAIGTVDAKLTRVVRTDASGKVIYSASFKGLQKLPE